MNPAYQRISPVNIMGGTSNRLMVVLRTKGCEYARRTGGGCTVCGFLKNASDDIRHEQIIEQFDTAINSNDLSNVGEIDILTLGSFFNDSEVSQETRVTLMKKVRQMKHIKRVSIESRAEYVTTDKIKQCKSALNGQCLEFAIGLESADDYVRNVLVKKGLTKRGFEETVAKVKEAGDNLLVYLLIKPPGLTEKQAIEDAVASARYVFDVAAQYGVNARVAFEPVFVCESTQLEKLYLQSQYRLLNLWSVVEVIKQSHRYGNIFVGLSDENLSMDRMPNSCPKCYGDIVSQIEHFNATQDISGLEAIQCDCVEDYRHSFKNGDI